MARNDHKDLSTRAFSAELFPTLLAWSLVQQRSGQTLCFFMPLPKLNRVSDNDIFYLNMSAFLILLNIPCFKRKALCKYNNKTYYAHNEVERKPSPASLLQLTNCFLSNAKFWENCSYFETRIPAPKQKQISLISLNNGYMRFAQKPSCCFSSTWTPQWSSCYWRTFILTCMVWLQEHFWHIVVCFTQD